MKKRIINNRYNYVKSIFSGINELLKSIMENQIEQNKTKWITTKQYMTETKTTFGQFEKYTKK